MRNFRILTAFLLIFLLLPLAPAQASEEEMHINANAAILIDAVYGDVLYEQNADARVYGASTTKIMTAILVIEAVEMGGLSLDTVVTAQIEAIEALQKGSSTQNIKCDETLTVRELLYCLMVASANDAANILAIEVAGSLESFVNLMNQKAQDLNLTGTQYRNAHGYHDDNHYTTARDLSKLTRYAMEDDLFRELVATSYITIPATNLSDERVLHTTNYQLSHRIIPGYIYNEAIGVKTGYTEEAGHCLVSAARRGERMLISVVMGTQLVQDDAGKVLDRPYLSESTRLLKWGFSDYSRREILSTMDLIGERAVTLSKIADYVTAQPAAPIEATVARDVSKEDFERVVTWNAESLQAPVAKGQVLGTVTLMLDGQEYGSVDLVALNDVAASIWSMFWKESGRTVLYAILAVLCLAVAGFVLVLVLQNRRRNQKAAARGRTPR